MQTGRATYRATARFSPRLSAPASGDTQGQFLGAANLEITASDTPDLSGTSSLSYAFYGATNFTSSPSIGDWDVSRVTDMDFMFCGTAAFNQDLSAWCVSNFTDEPSFFDAGTPLENNPENHPDWGASCVEYDIGDAGPVRAIDVTNWTYNPNSPVPISLSRWNPQKLYASDNITHFVRDNGGVLQMYFDDFAFADALPKAWR
jgi:hypothetical protein